MKHLQIRLLWLQAAIREGKLTVHPVGTKENTADLGTKPLSTKRVKFLLNMIGMCSSEGRVGQQEREEDKAQVVRRLEKVMKNKSSMLFALSSLLLQKSEAVNAPLAAAQEAQGSKPQEVPGTTGSMSLRFPGSPGHDRPGGLLRLQGGEQERKELKKEDAEGQ